MLKRRTNIFLFLISLITLGFSCRKIETYPVEPEITFEEFAILRSIEGQDSIGILSIGFTDGDGDIGATENDSSLNYFLDIFEVVNGSPQQVELPDSTVNFDAYIPDLTPDGKYKAIKGTINFSLPLYFMTPFLNSDTIFFETSIADRAMHQSNVITTPQFIVN